MKLTAILAAVLTLGHETLAWEGNDLTVDTGAHLIRGVLEDDMPNVRVFRGVPYAEPPLGKNRFLPPVTKKPSTNVIDASWFGPSCIQLNTGEKTVYTEYLQGFLLTPGQKTEEDCLSLNIWAPRGAEGQSLPVILYIPGGGFTSGGSASPYKYGGPMVRDQQDVIVVSLK
jgi:carboxylesterase type B